MEKMQHCYNCGEEIGIYRSYPGDRDICGAVECSRQARDDDQAERDEAQYLAAQDDWNRYR